MKKFAKDIVAIPFRLCVLFLVGLGKCLGLNYKQISVYFNLYLQGIIMVASGLLPLMASVYRFRADLTVINSMLVVCMLCYFSMYIIGGYCLIKHYSGDVERCFDTCVADLQKIADSWHMTYQMVNIIIFIIWWTTVVCVNLMLTIFVMPGS